MGSMRSFGTCFDSQQYSTRDSLSQRAVTSLSLLSPSLRRRHLARTSLCCNTSSLACFEYLAVNIFLVLLLTAIEQQGAGLQDLLHHLAMQKMIMHCCTKHAVCCTWNLVCFIPITATKVCIVF